MIEANGKVFACHTKCTSYIFHIMQGGQPEHLYYGKKIKVFCEGVDYSTALVEKQTFAPGNTIIYDSEANYTLENVKLEMSSLGKGDIREPFMELVYPFGGRTSDFVYNSYEICDGVAAMESLPYALGGENVQHLKVVYKDRQYPLELWMYYTVFENEDVITRRSVLVNSGDEPVDILRLMSLQLDFPDKGYVMTTFNGGWTNEMNRNDTKVVAGNLVNSSVTGTSSNRANPFIMLSKEGTDEDGGVCMGFNLLYSGNHYEALSVSGHGKSRLLIGINPQGFSWRLGSGEHFESPEAIMTWTDRGFTHMSHNLHRFVREHISRGEWQHKVRPVLLNSWEANYFDINEARLLRLARLAAQAGIEMFVMDDGWFGERNDDRHSLGDWEVNTKKLPGGLDGLCTKINSLGLDFGIWVEPEMVNCESKLYAQHPDWALCIPGKHHSEGRNQRILDLCNPEVREYIYNSMERILSSANISYVKWDMNRIFSDNYSQYLEASRQGEVVHRYYIGLYEILGKLKERFPYILFEGCAAGGNRFDLGALCYFDQIWASDNTDAICRSSIQENLSYGYPASVYTAHVSACPNHQTLRTTPLSTRFNVAAFSVCGYECNLSDMGKAELDEIKAQVELYKQWREVFQFGDFYRQRSGRMCQWTAASPDKSRAVTMLLQTLVKPNPESEILKVAGLDPDELYHIYNIQKKHDIREFGDLINTVSPIHIANGSIAQKLVAKFVTMPGEVEDYIAYGDMLMNAGISLKQAFGATGYSEEIRHFPDFASRMYFVVKNGKDSVAE